MDDRLGVETGYLFGAVTAYEKAICRAISELDCCPPETAEMLRAMDRKIMEQLEELAGEAES